MGEASRRYYMRCPDLGVYEWEATTGPISVWRAIRMKLARIDQDEAYPVVLGGKKVIVELRYENSNRVFRYECSGTFSSQYQCDRLPDPRD